MSEKLATVALDDIVPADDNLRAELTDIQTLADSIAFIGLLEPIRIQANGTPGKYKIIAGHRRYAALRLNGETETKAIIQSGKAEDANRTAAMLIENMQRVDLDIAEQAEGVRRLVQDHGFTQAEIAENLGVSKEWVKDRIAILNVPEHVMKSKDRPNVAALAMLGQLTPDHLERATKDGKIPSQYEIEDRSAKIRQADKAETLKRKLLKAGHLVTTQTELKKLIGKKDLSDLEGNDFVIASKFTSAQAIAVNSWQAPKTDNYVMLHHIYGNTFDLDKAVMNTVYVLGKNAGYPQWYSAELVVVKKAKAETSDDEIDEITRRNDERRAQWDQEVRSSVALHIQNTKPAELIAQVLRFRVLDTTQSYRSSEIMAEALNYVGAEVYDEEIPEDMAHNDKVEIRQRIQAERAEAVLTYADKNAANLARMAFALMWAQSARYVETQGYVTLPPEPEYEEYPDSEEDAF